MLYLHIGRQSLCSDVETISFSPERRYSMQSLGTPMSILLWGSNIWMGPSLLGLPSSLPDGASESILADIHKEVSLLLECWLLSSAYRTWSTGINTDAFLFVTASSISTIACPMNVDTSRANLLVWRYYNWCFKK